MKKKLMVFIASLSLLILTSFLYFFSANPLEKGYANTQYFFQNAERIELLVENHLLKHRDFIVVTFEDMDMVQKEVRYLCAELRNPDRGIVSLNARTHADVETYCGIFKERLENLGKFKERQVHLRDLLVRMESEYKNHGKHLGPLTKAALFHQIFASGSTRESFAEQLKKTDPVAQKAGKKTGIAKDLYGSTEIIDQLTRETIHPVTSEILNRIRFQYNQQYWSNERRTKQFRIYLSTFAAIMLLLSLGSAASLMVSLIRHANNKIHSISDMAGYLAHEINNPLTTALYKVNQLNRQIETAPELSGKDIARDISILQDATEQIHKFAKGIRTLSIDHEQQIEQVDVENLMEKTLDLFLAKFQKYGVRFEYVHDSKSQLLADCRPQEISQALLNLLTNAFEAVRPVSDKWIRIQLSEGAEGVRLNLSHSGSKSLESVNFSKDIIVGNKGQFSFSRMDRETQFRISLPKSPVDKFSVLAS